MLYPKNSSRSLEKELFESPTSEYRGTPFWAWNCELYPDILKRQIDYLKEMGMGGFHMHSRTGMATPYLSDEFMSLIKCCVEKARSEDMLAWLYDEDRWPSGFAGGLVTKKQEYRARHLLFTKNAYLGKGLKDSHDDSSSSAMRMENGRLIAKYDIALDADGCLLAYRMLGESDTGNNVWYAYLEISGNSPWFNDQSYVNTLDKKAIDEFIRITYETYKKWVGSDFGDLVPAIFTDEPQFSHKTAFGYARETKDIFLPWTDDLPETFTNEYGTDILKGLPELFWEFPDGRVSVLRYRYHDHVTQRFTEAFADNCGNWCRSNGLKLTGHMMEEATLKSQTAALGEAMRAYRSFDLPGIDMLCDAREYNTAKQAQSAVHQFGYEGMLSELYGVTNWDFDFRGHKLQGDWQAALGVTVRVHHLSWVSMKGEAKRDYPASINYQAPWFREYKLIEDHFARINTALTRGKPMVRVGVIHPVESYWLYWGPSEQTSAVREQLDSNHSALTEWLIFGSIDFDFISESLFPEQCSEGSFPLKVGQMDYDTIIVPGCHTLRKTTIDRLSEFLRQGGRLIIAGNEPKFIEAVPVNDRVIFGDKAIHIPFEKTQLLDALLPVRMIDIRNSDGSSSNDHITQMRKDGDSIWLFVAKGRTPVNADLISPKEIVIRIEGNWSAELYDTLTGVISIENTVVDGSHTLIKRKVYSHDSLLYRLMPGKSSSVVKPEDRIFSSSSEGFFGKVPVSLSEPNCMLLDIAEYAFDDDEYQPSDELLRIDNKFRSKLGLPLRMAAVAQPWVREQDEILHILRLRFKFQSRTELNNVSLAMEDADSATVRLNGTDVPVVTDGWYVDESIRMLMLPVIHAGENVLEVSLPFGRNTDVEWLYLLGDFGVEVRGTEKILTESVRELYFGDFVSQGLPFYGGNVTYRLEVNGDGRDVRIQASLYRGAMIAVNVDGERAGTIVFDPYAVTIPALSEGPHIVELTLFGNRVNSFGAVHNCDMKWRWHGPGSWRTTDDRWSYEYTLRPTGILKSPAVIYADAPKVVGK